jgi:hypothetical protein
MSNLNEGNAFLGDVNSIVSTLMCMYCKATEDYILECQSVMKVLLFLCDVDFNVYALLCGYCEAIKDKNPKCQTLMRVMHFYVMLVYVL